MLSLLFLLAVSAGGPGAGLLYVAPALLLLVPMLTDSGERRVMALAARLARPRRRVLSAPRLPAAPAAPLLARGGRLIGAGLAARPPPALGLA